MWLCFLQVQSFHGSKVVEQVDQYNNLSAMLLNSPVNSNDCTNRWSSVRGTNPANPVAFTGYLKLNFMQVLYIVQNRLCKLLVCQWTAYYWTV